MLVKHYSLLLSCSPVHSQLCVNAVPTINCLTTPEEGSGNITFRWTVTDAGGEEAKITSIRIDYKSNTNNALNFSLLKIANLTDEAMDPKLLTVDTGFLNAGESYSFRISAGNNVGIGEPTDCPAVTLLTGEKNVIDIVLRFGDEDHVC